MKSKFDHWQAAGLAGLNTPDVKGGSSSTMQRCFILPINNGKVTRVSLEKEVGLELSLTLATFSSQKASLERTVVNVHVKGKRSGEPNFSA